MIVVNVTSVKFGFWVVSTHKRLFCRCCCCCGGGGSWWLNCCHEVVEDLAGRDPVVCNSEDHLHVVRAAASSDTPVKIFWGGGGDEVVILAGVEFKAAGSGGERSEGDGEVHQPVRLVANGNNCWLGIGDSARVKLLTADAVDDVFFRVLDAGLGDWADDVDLVILPGFIANIDVDNVIGVVNSEHGVGLVPVDVVKLLGVSHGSQTTDDDKK